MKVDLLWIGPGSMNEAAMEHARAHLEHAFGRPVALGVRAGRPEEAFDAKRGQWSSSRLLGWLASGASSTAERVLGVTDEDLFIPVLTYVFGEAQLFGRAAVVSTARLMPAPAAAANGWRALLPGADEPQRLLENRLAKECAHELGHTYGLVHCPTPSCVMSRSASLAEVDRKDASLCPRCRGRLLPLGSAGEGKR